MSLWIRLRGLIVGADDYRIKTMLIYETLVCYRPHTLPPHSLYLAHLAPYLASTQAQLETELQAVQTENIQLAKDVEGQRDEVERLVGGLEAVIADLEEANMVMGEVVDGDVRKEAMEMESEIGGRSRSRL